MHRSTDYKYKSIEMVEQSQKSKLNNLFIIIMTMLYFPQQLKIYTYYFDRIEY